MSLMTYFHRFKRSIGYVILAVAIAYALVVQNNNTNQIEVLVKANTEQIARNDLQDCLFTQNSRETVRSILSSIINQFPPGESVDSIRSILENDYPPIVCSVNVPERPDGDPGTPDPVPGPATTVPETVVVTMTIPTVPETTVVP